MEEYGVLFKPEEKQVRVNNGENLLQAAIKAGIYINSECGGEGVCGRCKVQVIQGKTTSSPSSLSYLSKDEIEQGFVLACQAEVHSDIVVSVPSGADLEESQILKTENALSYNDPERLEDNYADNKDVVFYHPLTKKIFLELPQPTLDDSVPDQERLFRAIRQKKIAEKTIKMDMHCLRILPGLLRKNGWHVTATLRQHHGITEIGHLEPGDTSRENYGIALDVGTTTVVAELVELRTGKVLGVSGSHNQQIRYGEDVISRIIFACSKNGLAPLKDAVVENINSIIEQLVTESSIAKDQITAVMAAGNPTMIHLLLGLQPCHIRLEPYIPASNEYPSSQASDLGLEILPRGVVTCIPGVSSYVGGDITAGVLASGLHSSPETSALIDLGTNGEIAVGNNEWMVCCSASAGPAFEGGGLQCGMRATKGAIQKVTIENGAPRFSVIGNGKARGICGSGLIDLMSEMLMHNIIDPNGAIVRDSGNKRIRTGENETAFVLAFADESDSGKDIFVTESEIKNVIKSKAAVFSAAKILIESMGLTFLDLDHLFVSGGFGNYLNVKSAISIGLLPDIAVEKIRFIGNSSLSGAKMCLLSTHAAEEAKLIAKKMTYFELSTNTKFMEEFMAAMFLPHTDLDLFPTIAVKKQTQPSETGATISENRCRELKKEIGMLRDRLTDRKAALPMHDATPQQWIEIEELEDEISLKKKKMKSLQC